MFLPLIFKVLIVTEAKNVEVSESLFLETYKKAVFFVLCSYIPVVVASAALNAILGHYCAF